MIRYSSALPARSLDSKVPATPISSGLLVETFRPLARSLIHSMTLSQLLGMSRRSCQTPRITWCPNATLLDFRLTLAPSKLASIDGQTTFLLRWMHPCTVIHLRPFQSKASGIRPIGPQDIEISPRNPTAWRPKHVA